MNTLQAHGTTMHELSKNTAGQSQLQGTYGCMTAANAMEHTNAKQTENKCYYTAKTLANAYKECH